MQQINFMGQRRLALVFSLTLMAISLGSLLVKGLSLGIDFKGGMVVEASYPDAVELDGLRAALGKAGFDEAVVQHFGSARDVLIRMALHKELSNAKQSSEILKVLNEHSAGKAKMRRVEFVGAQVGEELTQDGGLAVLFALIGIFIYVWTRFEWQFAAGSIFALAHDVIITMGFFSVTGVEFDLTVLAAVLAVIGYSLNDTIVVFDRIRENFRILRKKGVEESMNISVNQTLSRTLVTSLTTLLVLLALFLVGGEIIHGFSLALIVGVVIGTYSSIYVASTSALILGITREAMIPPKREDRADDGAMP